MTQPGSKAQGHVAPSVGAQGHGCAHWGQHPMSECPPPSSVLGQKQFSTLAKVCNQLGSISRNTAAQAFSELNQIRISGIQNIFTLYASSGK